MSTDSSFVVKSWLGRKKCNQNFGSHEPFLKFTIPYKDLRVLLNLQRVQTRRESVPIVRKKLSQRVHEHERHEHGQHARLHDSPQKTPEGSCDLFDKRFTLQNCSHHRDSAEWKAPLGLSASYLSQWSLCIGLSQKLRFFFYPHFLHCVVVYTLGVVDTIHELWFNTESLFL